MSRRERSKVKATNIGHICIPIILCVLAWIPTAEASLGLSCTVCSVTHLHSNISCTWHTEPVITYSAFFKLQLGTSCSSLTTWQVCSSSAEGTCDIPFFADCESEWDRYQVKVESSNLESETVGFSKSEITQPHPPEDLTIQTDSSTQLTVHWTMSECTDVVFGNSYTCQIEYTSQWNSTRTTDGRVEFFDEKSMALRGLTPYTVYKIRVRCQLWHFDADDSNWGDYTATVEAQTLAAAPSQGPNVQTPTDVWLDYKAGLRNVSLQWQALSTIHHNGILQGYVIRLRDLRTAEVSNFTVVDSGAQTYTYTLVNLKLSGYQVDIMAYNWEGLSPPATRSIQDRARKPDPPRNLVSMATSDNNIQLSWQPPAEIGGIETYTVVWCKLETDVSCLDPEKNLSVMGSQLSVKVIDTWEPFTRYRFALKAGNSAGLSELSNAAVGYTVQGVPSSPPQNVTVQAETATSLLVEWNAPPVQDRRGVITTYRVYYYVTPSVSGQQMVRAEQIMAVNITDDSQPVQLSLSELEPFTSYTVTVSAVTIEGEGNRTEPTGARTSQAAPSDPPTNIQVSDVTVNTVALSWIPPSQPNGIIHDYIIKHGSDTTPVGNLTEVVLRGLEGDVNYTIQVQGCTAAETPCGPFSPVEYVLTRIGAPGIVQDLRAEFDPTNGRVHVVWNPPMPKNGQNIRYIISYGREDKNKAETPTADTHWSSSEVSDSCADGLQLEFRVQAQTLDVLQAQAFVGPYSPPVLLSCDDRPKTLPSGGDRQKDRLRLEAKVGIIVAVLIAFLVALAALVPTVRKMYKKSQSDIPGPVDFITDQGTYSQIPDGHYHLIKSLNNVYIISEQTGKTPEVLDDLGKLKVERQWSQDSAFGSDYGNNNIDLEITDKIAYYSTGGSSSGYSEMGEDNSTVQTEASKATNAKNPVVNSLHSDVADYSKLSGEDGNFEDLKVNYVSKQGAKTIDSKHCPDTNSSGKAPDHPETITDYSRVAAARDQKKDLDVNYVCKTGTDVSDFKRQRDSGVHSSEEERIDAGSRKHADTPHEESPVPIKCKILDPDKIVYITNN